jgi:hypothetical protein
MKSVLNFSTKNFSSLIDIISLFGSVVAVAFQITFHAEIHANDFFYFLKIIFDISTSKRSKKYKPYSILAKKKNSKFDET